MIQIKCADGMTEVEANGLSVALQATEWTKSTQFVIVPEMVTDMCKAADKFWCVVMRSLVGGASIQYTEIKAFSEGYLTAKREA